MNGPSSRPSQLAFDLGDNRVAQPPAPQAARRRPNFEPTTRAKPKPAALAQPEPSADLAPVRLEHAGQAIEIAQRLTARQRVALEFLDEPRRVALLLPQDACLEQASKLARANAARIIAWLNGEALLRDNEERIVLKHGERELRLLLQRSLRARRISLKVKAERGEVALVVPQRASARTAVDFAQSNIGWIAARLDRMPQPSPFVDGGEVPLRGVPHRIRHRPERRGTVWLQGGEIHVAGDARHLRRRLLEWLAHQAGCEIAPLVQQKAAKLAANGRGRRVRGITIRDTVSRWGSCGADGSIMLSWRMILAPPAILDYLVAHEVAHLAEQNHSSRFWQICAELSEGPIEAAEAWLRAHGNRLLQYGARTRHAG